MVLPKPEFLVVWVMKEIVFEDEEWVFLMDIQRDNKLDYYEELMAGATREL